jgi:hypothetical protein
MNDAAGENFDAAKRTWPQKLNEVTPSSIKWIFQISLNLERENWPHIIAPRRRCCGTL